MPSIIIEAGLNEAEVAALNKLYEPASYHEAKYEGKDVIIRVFRIPVGPIAYYEIEFYDLSSNPSLGGSTRGKVSEIVQGILEKYAPSLLAQKS